MRPASYWIRVAAVVALLLSGVAIVVRSVIGPFQAGFSFRNPIGAESVFATSLLVLLLFSTGFPKPKEESGTQGKKRKEFWTSAFILAVAGLISWSWSFDFNFIADDYVHITNALHADSQSLKDQFTVPAGDRFFRPLVYVAYAAEAEAFGNNRVAWHAFSLLLHFATALLVFTLARRWQFGRWPSLAAALLFLLHGSRPEAVAWVSAQFDLWAALFTLAALLSFIRFQETGQPRWRIFSLLLLFGGLLSKESAYVYPALLMVWLRFDRVPWAKALRFILPSAILTACVFLYRWILLGGIGGYKEVTTGKPFIFTFSPLRIAKALFVRPQAISLFPVNWSAPFEPWLVLGIVAFLVPLLVVAARTVNRLTIDRRKLLSGFCLFLFASLPVHQFLLMDSDLEKSRVLYLPLLGLALLFASILESLTRRSALALTAGALVFQFTALEHNLKVWRSVTELADRTCKDAAKQVTAASGSIQMYGIPNVVDGVYFLHTGFRNCVAWAAQKESLPNFSSDTDGASASAPPAAAAAIESWRWMPDQRKLVRETESDEPVSGIRRPE